MMKPLAFAALALALPPAVQLAPIAYADQVLDGKPVRGGTFIAVVLFDGSIVDPREERPTGRK
jgi:hypothetical protein